MKILFNEQDMIDSACVLVSNRHGKDIETVQAEIFYEEGKGFYASSDAHNGFYNYHLSEQDIIDGIAMYLSDYHNFDPNQIDVELFFEEDKGFSAVIDKR
jgi:hypothetical protein